MTRRIKRIVAAMAVALAAVGFVAAATASTSVFALADDQPQMQEESSEWG